MAIVTQNDSGDTMSEKVLQEQVLTESDSSVRETRLRAVSELERLANSADLTMAAAARFTLMRLTEEDSRIRDVVQGPDCALYLLTDDRGQVLRVSKK